jgi:hypothetical protein
MAREADINARAEADGAYSRNGLSIYSREVSRARRKRLMGEARSMTARQMIDKHERELRELRADLLSARPKRREHIERDVRAKENFLKRLWQELADAGCSGRALSRC